MNAQRRAAREEIDFKELLLCEGSPSSLTIYPQDMTCEVTL